MINLLLSCNYVSQLSFPLGTKWELVHLKKMNSVIREDISFSLNLLIYKTLYSEPSQVPVYLLSFWKCWWLCIKTTSPRKGLASYKYYLYCNNSRSKELQEILDKYPFIYQNYSCFHEFWMEIQICPNALSLFEHEPIKQSLVCHNVKYIRLFSKYWAVHHMLL